MCVTLIGAASSVDPGSPPSSPIALQVGWVLNKEFEFYSSIELTL